MFVANVGRMLVTAALTGCADLPVTNALDTWGFGFEEPTYHVTTACVGSRKHWTNRGIILWGAPAGRHRCS